MPLFSCFTPFGVLAFSSKPSEAQKQYQVIGTQLDQALDTTPGYPTSEDNEGEKYANARHLARQVLALQHAGYQRDVTKASDLLPLREADYQVTPGPYDTLVQRQNRLLALRALPLGATTSNITSALSALLGSGFIKLRTVAHTELTSNLPTSNFQPPGIIPKFLQLAYPIAVTGSQWATYQNLDTTIAAPVTLALGDKVTVGGENNSQAEVVSVTGLRSVAAGLQFQATFTQSHDAGSTVTTMPFPRWTSSQSFLYVEVTAAVASNPVQRQQIDAIMQKLTRGTVEWATVSVASGLVTQFQIATTPLGTGTVGSSVPA
jgi:hypothetical protein